MFKDVKLQTRPQIAPLGPADISKLYALVRLGSRHKIQCLKNSVKMHNTRHYSLVCLAFELEARAWDTTERILGEDVDNLTMA